MLMWQ